MHRFALVVLAGTLLPASASANSISTSDCSLNFKDTFALNEIVCGIGDVDTPCQGSIIGAADIWVIPAGAPDFTLAPGSTPKRIVTAGGAGGFWSEILWLPDLVPGSYDLLMDEDCNGSFNGIDRRVEDAFTVLNFDTGVDIDVTAIKAAAAAEAQRWIDIKNGWDLTVAVVNLIGKVNTFASAAGGDFSGLIGWVYGKATGMPTDYNGAVLQVGTQIIHGLTNNMAIHWLLLAADPPDGDYQPLVTLDWSFAGADTDGLPAYPYAPMGSAPVEAQVLEVAGLLAEQAVLGDAFIRQFEKYQGADADGSNPWIHTTASRTKVLADAMVDHFDAMETALGALETTLLGEPDAALENDPGEFAAIQARLGNHGLDAEEVAALEEFGLGPAEREAFVDATLAAEAPPEAFSPLSLVQDMKGRIPTIRAAYQGVADQASATMLAEAPYAGVTHPVADAGGPYTATVGVAQALTAANSTDPDGQALSYAWDLDADGAFDDATGVGPSWTWAEEGTRLVAVMVTDADGAESLAMARVSVGPGNLPPRIDAFEPSEYDPFVGAGASLLFSVEASDPEGDVVSVEWTVDGEVVGSELEWTWTPTIDLGRAHVQVRVSDSNAISRDTFEERYVQIGGEEPGDDDDDAAGDDDDDAGDDDDDPGRGGCACAAAEPSRSGSALALAALFAVVSRRRARG